MSWGRGTQWMSEKYRAKDNNWKNLILMTHKQICGIQPLYIYV